MNRMRPRVAVVDDEEAVRKAIHRLLRSAGMDVETFPSGAEFLDAIRTQMPDCLVLDLHMPGVDGFEVQSRLAQSGTRLPVVVITGNDTPECHSRALAGGARAYLLKPIDGSVLLEAIAAAVSKQGNLG
jgi:FixJ family two-component response regulator